MADQLDPTKLTPEALRGATGEIRNALAKIRAGQITAGGDTKAADAGIAQLDGLKSQLDLMVARQFIGALDQMAARAYSAGLAKKPRDILDVIEDIRFAVSELAFKRGKSERAELMATAILGLLDLAACEGLQIGAAVLTKHRANVGAPQTLRDTTADG